MANGDRHAERELRIFSGFAEASPRQFDLSTLEKRQPKHPDVIIECDGSSVAFELVELIDQDFARSIALMLDTRKMVQDKFEDLPEDRKQAFEEKYSDALLNFSFTEVPFGKRREIVNAVLDELMSLEDGFQGRTLQDSKDFAGVLNFVVVSRGECGRLKLDAESAGLLDDPTLDMLQNKFGKQYESDCPMELLAYIESHPTLPDDIWLPKVKIFVSKHLKKSPFERVTIYDINKAIVRFEHSALEGVSAKGQD